MEVLHPDGGTMLINVADYRPGLHRLPAEGPADPRERIVFVREPDGTLRSECGRYLVPAAAWMPTRAGNPAGTPGGSAAAEREHVTDGGPCWCDPVVVPAEQLAAVPEADAEPPVSEPSAAEPPSGRRRARRHVESPGE